MCLAFGGEVRLLRRQRVGGAGAAVAAASKPSIGRGRWPVPGRRNRCRAGRAVAAGQIAGNWCGHGSSSRSWILRLRSPYTSWRESGVKASIDET